jgi:hypothetical protein
MSSGDSLPIAMAALLSLARRTIVLMIAAMFFMVMVKDV